MKASGKITSQVIWNRLISVVEEQAQALIRTAFSTSVREAGDLSAGVYDEQGRMLAQAVTGTPGHVNAMAAAVGHFINHFGIDSMREGDVYITNDPWLGTGHLHDITVVTPVIADSCLIGFFACTAHVVDIGGRGFSADADSVYEEGLRIPLMHLFASGKLNESLLALVRANVREPDQVVGDIHALTTCNQIGLQRLTEMMDEFEIIDLGAISDFILRNSRRATLQSINALTPGRAKGAMRIDGYATPIDLHAEVIIEQDRVRCDFSGSSPVDPKGINVPMIYTEAYACYALKCAIAPQVPNNAASLAPFQISAPQGCILNAHHPAPVALRHVIGHMLPDTVYAALDQLVPGLVPAEGAGTLCNFQLSLKPVQDTGDGAASAEVLTFNSGGSGARPSGDGMNATAFPSGVMTMPVEATEHAGPVVIWRKELRPDSGGAGQYRGGLGQLMEVAARDGYQFEFSAMFDRVAHPARGRHGGKAGAPTRVELDDGSVLMGKSKQSIPIGSRVRLAFPGGGGYGDASQRVSAAIRRDLQRGYLSPQAVTADYQLDAAVVRELAQHSGSNEEDS